MLNFFRKIRKQLAADNKPFKYMRYAIGEIVLVVAGILIALQINNWNEERKDRNEEQQLLIQLREEYTSNLEQLDQKVSMRNRNLINSFKMLDYIDNPDNVVADSIIYYLSACWATPTFDPIENDLINSGKLELIQDPNLKRLLTSWKTDVQQLNEVEQDWWEYVSGRVDVYFTKTNLTRNKLNSHWKSKNYQMALIDTVRTIQRVLGRSRHPVDYFALLEDPELESHLASAIGAAEFQNLESATLRNEILLILELINNSLKD
ncbi:MAG: hypothetical protein KJN76_11510 [Eudoraea sp.]|nr:hypothetical protein [Eudoraea sp.]